jgi:hypothetical protein
MKKIILISFLFFLSCGKNKPEMASIEIMAYYYNFDDNQEYRISPILYSIIDKNGNLQTIRKMPSSDSKFYYSENNDELLNKIILETENKSEKDYEIKFDSTSTKIYCGPIIRFRIKKSNGKELSFLVDNYSDSNIKFLNFVTLYNKLSSDTLSQLKNRNEIKKLLISQKIYKEFSFKKDLTNLPPTPPIAPKIDEIKFVKGKNY